jgi:hypothetical protein
MQMIQARSRSMGVGVAAAVTGLTLTHLLLSVDHRLIGNVNGYDAAGLRRPPNR